MPEPLTPQQIAARQEINAACISPDGASVVFVVKEASKSDEHPTATIWIAPFAGDDPGGARPFTSGLWNDHSPRWSSDGTSVAFLSDRAERGKRSVYVIQASGGEATRVFDQQGDMSGLVWAPDGRSLSVLYTEPETEEEKKRKEDRDDANVWDEDQNYQQLWVIDLEARLARLVSPPRRQVRAYAWSPDSSRFAVCTTPNSRMDEEFLENEVAIIPVSGGEPTRVFTQVGVTEDLTWSSDGNYLAYRARASRVVHPEYVYRISLHGGDPTCLTDGYCGTVTGVSAFDDGRQLLMLGSEGFNLVPYSLGWNGERTQLLDRPCGWSHSPMTVSHDGTRLAAAWQNATHAPNLWVAATLVCSGDGRLRKRTGFNRELEQAALGETEFMSWASDAGVEVEGILVKPFGYRNGQRYPLVVQVHGGPTWAWSNWFYADWHDWAQMLAGRGYAVLMPNPRGSTGRGPEYASAIFNDVGGGEFRDMMAGVDALIERGIADPERLGIGGWSWGGYMTAWTVTQTTRFKAAVMGAGLPNMISDNGIGDIPSSNLSYFDQTPYHDPGPYFARSAIRYISRVSTPTLILHGEEDRRVHVTQGQEMYVALRTLGVTTKFVTYPREQHGIAERKHQIDLMNRVIDWYDRYLVRGDEDKGDPDGKG